MIIFLSFGAFHANAATYTAVSCKVTDVQAAFQAEQASPANGDVIVVPAGNCTWNSSLPKYTVTNSLTIQGATTVPGNCYPTACTAVDNTTITCASGCTIVFDITLAGGSLQVVRVTGFSLSGTTGNGLIGMGGTKPGPQVRYDHNHFSNSSSTDTRVYEPVYGVVDHNVSDNLASGQLVQVWEQTGDNGDNAFAASTQFGTANFVFVENNTVNNGYFDDCNVGGRVVFRYNVFTTSGPGGMQSHATGSTTNYRGCRATEIYNNVFNGGGAGGTNFSANFQTSGTTLQWGDTITGFPHALSLIEDRDGNFTYAQALPPNGWGYCGTSQTGLASSWDLNLNLNGSNGWPCIDQVGRGQSDQLSGVFALRLDTKSIGSTTGMWPHQMLEPVYMWNENWTCSGGGQCGGSTMVSVNSPNNNIVANRDYYVQVGGVQTGPTSPFDGSSGTGWGTLANRPTTCTAGPGGAGGASPIGSFGVGYFATDSNTLYICTAANSWTSYYTPYTYPHPLVSGQQSAGNPASPTNLVATVQ